MHRISWLLLILGLVGVWGCGGEEKEEAKPVAPTENRRSTRQAPRKAIPPELLWRVSTKATSQDEYDIKRRRRAEDGQEPTLEKLISLSQSFFSRIQPIQTSDSTIRYRGFDLEYFVPAMEKFSNDDFYTRYRRGTRTVPAAISIVDSIGPNNIDVFPFYVDHLILFFVHFHGSDVARRSPLVVPGFFVNDFEGKGTVYFQPAPNRPLKGVDDLAAVMLLKNHLVPERRLGLKEGHIEAYSQLSWRDSTTKEVRYSLRHGRACAVEYLDNAMTLPDLVGVLKKRCGGANRTLLPVVEQGRVPLWTEGPNYRYSVVKPQRRRALSEEDSLAAWVMDAGGGRRREVDRKAKVPTVSQMIKEAARFRAKIQRPAAGERLWLGQGMDFRKLTVNESKPGYQPRSALFHRNAAGEEDFVMLVDSSPCGLANVDLYPFVTAAAVYYFMDYHGDDPGHGQGQRMPGFFVFPFSTRSNLYFAPATGESVGSLTNVGMVMDLDEHLFPESALLLDQGAVQRHIEYNYAAPEGQRYDARISGMEVTPVVEDKDCAELVWDGKMTLDGLRKQLRRLNCRGATEEVGPPKENPLHPIWIMGSGLEKGEKKSEENEKSS